MTDTPATDLSTALLFGRYRIVQYLGDSRLASVYQATDERLRRTVLLHILRKELVEQESLKQRFVSEINAGAQRSHTTLLEVFDSGIIEDRPYMITEYVTGKALAVQGQVTIQLALLYVHQVAGAVAACQMRHVSHPPISSSNVLLVDEQRVKLVENWYLTAQEAALDLAHYRAPERATGHPSGPAATVYALGILLYELVTGQRPVRGTDPWSVSQAHVSTHIPPLSAMCPHIQIPTLERLLLRALAHDPNQRFADASAFSDALAAVLSDLSADTQRLVALSVAARTVGSGRAEVPRPVPVIAPAAVPLPVPRQPSVSSQAVPSARADDQDGLRPLSRETIQRKMIRHGITGWIVVLFLLCTIGAVSYIGASFVMDRIFAIELPRPSLPALPDTGFTLPDWLPGGDQGALFVVNAAALNVRDRPGVSDSTILQAIPNGTQVRQVGGPVRIGETDWIQVRARVDGTVVEGWVSQTYLTALE